MEVNIVVDRYLSPKLGRITTKRLFENSGWFPTFKAAATASPLITPLSNPSSLASLKAIAIDSSLETCSTLSTIDKSRLLGMNPAPIPCILWGPGLRSSPLRVWLITGLWVCSTATEINLLDGSQSGSIVNGKSVIYGASGEINATTLKLSGNMVIFQAILDSYPGKSVGWK